MPHIVLATTQPSTSTSTTGLASATSSSVAALRRPPARASARLSPSIRVTAELEAIAGREGHLYKVDPSRAEDGVVSLEVAPEGAPPAPEVHDILLEITIDACLAVGLGPSLD